MFLFLLKLYILYILYKLLLLYKQYVRFFFMWFSMYKIKRFGKHIYIFSCKCLWNTLWTYMKEGALFCYSLCQIFKILTSRRFLLFFKYMLSTLHYPLQVLPHLRPPKHCLKVGSIRTPVSLLNFIVHFYLFTPCLSADYIHL